MTVTELLLRDLGRSTALELRLAARISHEQVYAELAALEAQGKAKLDNENGYYKLPGEQGKKIWEWVDGVDIDAVHK